MLHHTKLCSVCFPFQKQTIIVQHRAIIIENLYNYMYKCHVFTMNTAQAHTI